tara:strand:- start:980 stop:1756 length:777 start_codon:yes stop_codon:yes gene_type:complete
LKNIVFQVNINGHRAKPEFEYSTKSWANWCKSNDFIHLTLTEPVYELDYMNANWHKFLCLELLENENIKYDQVCIVDADTIVHPDCPNFFDETDNKFSVVQTEGCYEWVNRSITNYGKFLFPKIDIKVWEYFNSGFMIINKTHRKFCDDIYKFYIDNRNNLVEAQEKFKVGTDQTPINYLVREHNIELKFLPNCYNLQDLFKKHLLFIDGYSWWQDDLVNMYNSGWVYHFNAIPPNDGDRYASYWLKRVYEELYENKK